MPIVCPEALIELPACIQVGWWRAWPAWLARGYSGRLVLHRPGRGGLVLFYYKSAVPGVWPFCCLSWVMELGQLSQRCLLWVC